MGEMMYARMAQSFPQSIPLDKVYGSWPSSPIDTHRNTHNHSPYGYSADSDTDSDTSSNASTSTLLLSQTSTTDESLPSSSLSLPLTSSSLSLPPKEKPFPFMRLPLEIRLQIYHWTVGMKSAPIPEPETPQTYKHAADESAARAAAVALSMSASSSLFYNCIPMYFGNNQWGGVAMGVFSSAIQQLPVVYRRVERGNNERSEEKKTKDERSEETKGEDIKLLPSHRPVGKSVPTSLLLANRQVYSEACRVGYEDAEFVFVRVFSSALSTAAAFVGLTLETWQRAAVRHVRMELDVSGSDSGLVNDSEKDSEKEKPILEAEKWTGLCASLDGLQNLRLLLNVTESANSSHFAGPLQDSPLLDGLLLLKSIRQIEIELVWTRRGRFASRAENMDAAAVAANLAWCAAVEARLRQAVPRVTVVNVERV